MKVLLTRFIISSILMMILVIISSCDSQLKIIEGEDVVEFKKIFYHDGTSYGYMDQHSNVYDKSKNEIGILDGLEVFDETGEKLGSIRGNRFYEVGEEEEIIESMPGFPEFPPPPELPPLPELPSLPKLP